MVDSQNGGGDGRWTDSLDCSTGGTGNPPELSVVIVTYNEAERIGDCLDSVFEASEEVSSFEVILVDSHSTDGTVEIASKYPITVLELPAEESATPAAGRFVGTHAASGQYILFVDGDMILRREFLREALSYLGSHDDVAAVDGGLNQRPSERRRTDAVRGVALYDSEALDDVGGFDPFLRSLEDIYLGFELTVAGYELYRLPVVAADHPDRTPVFEPIRRLRRGYMHGTGQALRKSLGNPRILSKLLGRLRYKLFLLVWVFVGLASLLSGPLLLGWLLGTALGFGLVVRELGVGGAVLFFFGKCIGVAGLVRGFAIPPRSSKLFSLTAVETIQSGPIHCKGEAESDDASTG